MYIEKINIGSFGKLSNREFELEKGINVFEGRNESGKSTVCEFIKFIFYGLSGKSSGGGMSERKRHISWSTNGVSGSIVINSGEKRYRIERSLTFYGAGYKEELTVVDLETNAIVGGVDRPGEYFFGIPEEVFTHTVYIRQADGAYFDGGDIGQAVQNIFYSADESVNTQKALKKLDDARAAIKHKKNTGRGLLDGLEAERDRLYVRLEEARETNKSLLSDENSLDIAKKAFERNKKDIERYSEILRKGELKGLLDSFDERDSHLAAAADCRRAEKELREKSSFNGFFPGDTYTAEANRAKNELAFLKKNYESYAPAEDSDDEVKVYSKELAGIVKDLGGLNGIVERVSSASRKSKACGIAAVIFGLIAAAGIIGSFFAEKAGMVTALLAAGAVSAAACLITAWTAAGAVAKNKKLFARFDAENDGELFETAANLEACVQADMIRTNKLSEQQARRAELEGRLKGAADVAVSHLAKWGRQPASEKCDDVIKCLEDAISEIGEIKAEISRLEREREKREALANLLTGQLAANEREAVKALYEAIPYEADRENAEEIGKRLDIIKRANEALTVKIGRLEKSIAAKKAVTDSPAHIESGLSAVCRRISELELKHDAYLLAYEKLQSAGVALRNRLAPGLSTVSGSLMEGLTDGKYKTIGVSDSLEMTYSFEDENGAAHTKNIDTVSAGTRDLAYMSLRLALAALLGKNQKTLPVVFDEAFSRLDDGRLSNMLSVIGRYSSNGAQILIMSSQSREAELFGKTEKGAQVNIITL